jgi:hypothetical protein
LQRQQAWLLPVPYFLLTFTLPEALRRIARRQQKLCYSFLFRLAAQATQQLAQDPRFVGGQIGMLGILHTWGRNLSFHPHVHFLVPGGGWDAEGQRWLPARKRFLLPVKALSRIFRAKFREALRRTPWFAEVPPAVWQQAWVVHCQPVGQGQQALGYLARYIFRVALSNHNLLQLDNDQVTFRYRASDTGQLRTCTLSALTFIGRFLQHVLPKGFVKVRYYGLFSPAQRQQLAAARQLLAEVQAAEPPHAADETHTGRPGNSSVAALMEGPDCPSCGRRMTRFRLLQPERGRPP